MGRSVLCSKTAQQMSLPHLVMSEDSGTFLGSWLLSGVGLPAPLVEILVQCTLVNWCGNKLSGCHSTCLFIRPYTYPSIHQPTHPSVNLPTSVFIYLSIPWSTYLPTFIHPPMHLSVCLSLSVSPSLHFLIHSFMSEPSGAVCTTKIHTYN